MGTYIHNLAMSLIGQLGLEPEVNHGDKFIRVEHFYEIYAEKLEPALEGMSPQTLGKISGCGLGRWDKGGTKLLEISDFEGYLSGGADGKAILVHLACMTVLAEVANIFREWHPDLFPASEYQTPEEVPDRVMHRSGSVG
ncbi:hypothetical protein KW800_01880 [Candidatus Parcubacteria bacterium]|nr:hypothetical protein [Candidatus Parcubacteria bacterium]